MANKEHLALLQQGVKVWNQWRKGCYSVLHQRCALAFQRAWGTAAPAGRQGLQTLKETGRKTFDHLRAIPWQAIASRHWKLLPVVGVVLMVGIIWKVPQWQAASWERLVEPKDLAKLQNDARTTLVQALGGAVLLIGLYFTLKNLQLTQDRQITEHYTRAVEQLGSDKLEVRLGAIYALERIARDSKRDHWPIMEILTAYVRKHAPIRAESSLKEDSSPSEMSSTIPPEQPRPVEDIQAILTVLSRRVHYMHEEYCLDLARTNLRGAFLAGAHLENAQLWGVNLEGAFLWGVHLEGAFLQTACLKGADFRGARLEKAFLSGAHLEEAQFLEAHLEEASLDGAHLERASLIGAHLEGASLGSDTHLEGAYLDQVHLEGANLVGVHLEGMYLKESYLQGARLVRAHLEGACLTKAHLDRADLSDAYLDKASLNQASLVGANLRAASLVGTELHHAHLEGADFSGAHLENAQLWWANLEGATLEKAHLEKADLEDASLAGACLRRAYLEGADFRGVSIARANLMGAYLKGARYLTVEQLARVHTLYQAELDPSLLQEIEWFYPHLRPLLLEKPPDQTGSP
jgi:uncharacterized protein YjbI with pentapeptide repeats